MQFPEPEYVATTRLAAINLPQFVESASTDARVGHQLADAGHGPSSIDE